MIFAGKIPPDNLPDYLAAADILLSPRISGTNTPLKLLDYLKAGRCILATDNPANRQILDDTTACFIKPEAPALASEICMLATNSELREALAARGAALMSRAYTYEKFRGRIAAVYKELEQEC